MRFSRRAMENHVEGLPFFLRFTISFLQLRISLRNILDHDQFSSCSVQGDHYRLSFSLPLSAAFFANFIEPITTRLMYAPYSCDNMTKNTTPQNRSRPRPFGHHFLTKNMSDPVFRIFSEQTVRPQLFLFHCWFFPSPAASPATSSSSES